MIGVAQAKPYNQETAVTQFVPAVAVEVVSLAGHKIRIPVESLDPKRAEYDRYRRLMATDDPTFRLHRLCESGNFTAWRERGISEEIIHWAQERSLREDVFKQAYYGLLGAEEAKGKTERAITPYGVSKALAKRLERAGVPIETALALSQDYATKPGNILKWTRDLRLNTDEIEYLLQLRKDVGAEASFSDLHRLWSACSNERSKLPGDHEGGGVAQEVFEQLLEHANDAVGTTKWSLWRLCKALEDRYDGDAQRLLYDLNDYGWQRVMSNATDRLTLAQGELCDLRDDGFEDQDWSEELGFGRGGWTR